MNLYRLFITSVSIFFLTFRLHIAFVLTLTTFVATFPIAAQGPSEGTFIPKRLNQAPNQIAAPLPVAPNRVVPMQIAPSQFYIPPADAITNMQTGNVAPNFDAATSRGSINYATEDGVVQEISSVPAGTPHPIQQVSGVASQNQGAVVLAAGTSTVAAAAAAEAPPGGTLDSVLGARLAKISTKLSEIPQNNGQIWREYDITPYTKGRQHTTQNPEQTVVEWILQVTGTSLWHQQPFGILTADSDKLYVYHTKDVQMLIADIVDRFVTPQFINEGYAIRVISLSKPDWIARGHQFLRPIQISTPGVQGWFLDQEGEQLLLQEFARRNDFKEVVPAQFLIPNGEKHQVTAKKSYSYLRDVQPNPSALNGYAEDRQTIEDGFGISFTPLALLDGLHSEAIIKLNMVQIEKMLQSMVEIPTKTNPRQRIQIESPQVSTFDLDEHIRWPKGKVLLLNLGTIPIPVNTNQGNEQQGFLSGIGKSLALNPTHRANILLFIRQVSTQGIPLSSGSAILPGQIPTLLPQNGVPLTISALPSAQLPSTQLPASVGRSGSNASAGTSSYWQEFR
ncbi:MAG: hypothetical protein ACRCUY_00880 [Thermoguttaceae bacterium]